VVADVGGDGIGWRGWRGGGGEEGEAVRMRRRRRVREAAQDSAEEAVVATTRRRGGAGGGDGRRGKRRARRVCNEMKRRDERVCACVGPTCRHARPRFCRAEHRGGTTTGWSVALTRFLGVEKYTTGP
jgi:hypothetical protein